VRLLLWPFMGGGYDFVVGNGGVEAKRELFLWVGGGSGVSLQHQECIYRGILLSTIKTVNNNLWGFLMVNFTPKASLLRWFEG
jgi:hypothetical protein